MAVVKRTGSKYYHIVLRKDGRQIWKSTRCADKLEARQLELEMIAIRDGKRKVEQVKTFIDRLAEDASRVSRGVSILDSWSEYLKRPEGQKMDRTLAQKRQMWGNFAAWMGRKHPGLKYLQDVTREIAVEYFDLVKAEKSASRHNHNKIALRSIFKALMFKANAASNPFDIIPTLAKPAVVGYRMLTLQEVAKILGEANDEWGMAVRLSFYTGLRFGDVCSLKWSEVDLDNGLIPGFVPSKTSRIGKKVDIPIAAPLKESLESYPRIDEYVLPTFHKRVKSHSFQEEFGKILDKAGVVDNAKGRVTFHSLRTTYVSHLIASGVALETVQKLVGHGSPIVTQGYNKTFEPLREAVGKLPKI